MGSSRLCSFRCSSLSDVSLVQYAAGRQPKLMASHYSKPEEGIGPPALPSLLASDFSLDRLFTEIVKGVGLRSQHVSSGTISQRFRIVQSGRQVRVETSGSVQPVLARQHRYRMRLRNGGCCIEAADSGSHDASRSDSLSGKRLQTADGVVGASKAIVSARLLLAYPTPSRYIFPRVATGNNQ